MQNAECKVQNAECRVQNERVGGGALDAPRVSERKRQNDNGVDLLLDAVACAQAADVVAAKGGLDGEIEQFGRNLSGGQRQRLTIARALVRRPEILILDDSSSALDFATDAALRKALRALPYRPTVFLVSQRTTAVRHADQIVVLDEGRMVGLGTHEQLLERCPVYREIHASQFRKEAAQ